MEEMRFQGATAAVIFDRDDTLIVDSGYMHRPEDIRWIDGAIKAVRYANANGYAAFVATNQSGIARGYYTESDMQAFHAAMAADLASEGARISGFFHCPHHPEGAVPAFAVDCDCRKPKPGLLHQIDEAVGGLDRRRSFLVGDKMRDIEAAKAFGIEGILFKGGNLLDTITETMGR